LFGILGSEDEEFYNSKISKLEMEQLTLIKLAREQMILFRSTLKSASSTIDEKFINDQNGEMSEIRAHFNVNITE
jgi:hypothetical protein